MTEIGFATFFLNRTNRSGILKGGVIGGVDQKGKYKINARYNTEDLIERIEKIAKYKKQVTLYKEDAFDFIVGIATDLEKKSLIYLDPPYYNKGSQLYRNFYTPEDHKQIINTVSSIKTPWVVTYDLCPEIEKLYQKESSVIFSLVYSTNKIRHLAQEILFYKNIEIPSPPILTKTIRPYPAKWDAVSSNDLTTSLVE